MIPTILILPKIRKPKSDLVQIDFVTNDMATYMIASTGEQLEKGDRVYLNEDGKVCKWKTGSKKPIFGFVQEAGYRLDTKTMVGGIIN